MLKSTIFGSNSEKRTFQNLDKNWGNNFKIYPNLGVKEIFNINKCDLSEEDKTYFFMAHFDYTLCERESGRAILSIEFDGVGNGFNHQEEFRSEIQGSFKTLHDGTKVNLKKRKENFERKLKLCHKAEYPLFIVSYSESHQFVDRLMIIDGIIGQYFHRKFLGNEINKSLDEEDFKNLPHDTIEEIIWDKETELEIIFDPLYYYMAELGSTLGKDIQNHILSESFLEDETIPKKYSVERILALKNTPKLGLKVTLKYGQEVKTEEFWINNFEGFGVSSLSILEYLTKILLYSKVLREKHIYFKQWSDIRDEWLSKQQDYLNTF